ncbi:MAG TPA: PLP-dependent aminotransferase family protein [Terracidiphilus sp.]|jgi:GntR family transcriptional regulator/MocR family aminotransferase
MATVSSGIFPVIRISRDSESPLHYQVYVGFRDAILRGQLGPGQQVPSSRALAAELEISRFPVLDAYAQLHVEGYFQSRKGAGTFVSSTLIYLRENEMDCVAKSEGTRRLSQRSSHYPQFSDDPWRDGWGAFTVHQPALDRFPFETWSKLVARHSRMPRAHAIRHIDPLGLMSLRDAICSYLRTARAVRCDPEQIMIVSGSQQALDITTRVLLDPKDSAWIEEPCYPLVRSVLLGSGCRVVPIPVDRDGLDVAAGIKRARNASAAFVTPSHQYPLGVTMSISRRLQLLEWARKASAWIIEDDYDSEFRFESMPIPSLQGLDTAARVIYIGTFSKVLFPSVRMGYLVVPADLVERFRSVRIAMDIFPPYLLQEVLTDFMTSGQFGRHIRRMRALYKSRRSALIESLHAEFGDSLEIHGTEAGMHLSVTLPDSCNDHEIAARAAAENLWLWPLSHCWSNGHSRQGMILGFGNTEEEAMLPAVRHLRKIVEL